MDYIDIFYSWSIFAAVLVPVVLLLIRRIGLVSGQPALGHCIWPLKLGGNRPHSSTPAGAFGGAPSLRA